MIGIFDWVQNILINHTFLAPVLYIFFHIIFATLIIPCSPMTVIAGILWGKKLGLLFSFIGSIFSCCVTFLFSRIFFKKFIYRILSKRYSKVDWFLAQTKTHGWKFVAAVQLNPAAPGSTLGYLFGLTDIEFFVYLKYLLIFMIPLQVVLVTLGDSISNLYLNNIGWNLAEVISILVISYFVIKVIRKQVGDNGSVINEK